MTTGVVYHPDYLQHETGHHPENPLRLKKIIEHLEKLDYLRRLRLISPRPASPEDVELVHDGEYVAAISHAFEKGVRYLDPDTPICSTSYRVALLAAGGVLEGIKSIMKKEVQNALVLCRPPGHHATRNRAMGFCIFNNVAIGAKYLTRNYQLDRVAVVDVDVHHGNGTQEIFYDDPAVLYVSLHQFPHYPGTGRADETGEGKARGTNLNIPIPPGAGDSEYMGLMETKVVPKLRDFSPQFILLSLGFDAHSSDYLSQMELTDDGYRKMTEKLVETAGDLCRGRFLSVLEGGYNLRVIPRLVQHHLDVLQSVQGNSPE